MAHQAHILNYVFLCGLVLNLINCENVVGGMSHNCRWLPSQSQKKVPQSYHRLLSHQHSLLPTLELPIILTHFTEILFTGLLYC